jgi:phosphotransferase system, enzyme I, PtsP
MLDTLQHIVQQVNEAANLDEALAIIVHRVKEAMAVDVCSVYIKNATTGYYVLMASDGLNPESVGRVRLALNEGLVGLVAARQELVNLGSAADHPAYRYIPETGEERYHSFLGVPLVHFRKLLGVLYIQRRARQLFAKDEVSFLVTIAAQLAGALSSAAPDGVITVLQNERPHSVSFNQGLPAAPGIAIGTIVLPSPFANLESVPDRRPQDIAMEEAAFREAVSAVQEELRTSAELMATRLPSEARAIFDVYVLMLGSDSLVENTVARMRAGNWAPGALRDTIAEYAQAFDQMEDPYLGGRAEDIRAIGRRLLMYLQSDAREPREYPERSILLGDEVSLARIAEVPADRLAGIVCLRGSVLSHIAIVAKALGVPAVMGLGHLPVGDLEGRPIVVDGYQGRVFIDPSPLVIEEFERLVRAEKERTVELRKFRELPAETLDGVRVTLNVNIGLLSETNEVEESGADGVGLYRTEFTFMVRHSFPVEDEQYHVYRKILESFAPKPVTMRTLDVGGDKPLPYYPMEEDNPALGWRGVRFTLDHPEIFLLQLRAMLRANVGLNNLRVLFPMVSQVNEVKEAWELLDRAHREHLEEGRDSAMPPVGVMIEVPSAVYQVREFARHIDFISIGTNDLTQYLLAVDRNNPNVARLYDSLHPAVLRALRAVARVARRYGKPVSVCGEMAGDPAAMILLLGMDIDAFSMSAGSLPRIKWAIRSITRRHARAVLREALRMDNAQDIRQMLNSELEQAGLSGLIRPGK